MSCSWLTSKSIAWSWHTGYSIWTNHDYKSPLLASAVACLVGNLAYCFSYDLGAVWLLFIARLVTGLGKEDLPQPSLAACLHVIAIRIIALVFNSKALSSL